jgi:hypothetical protein
MLNAAHTWGSTLPKSTGPSRSFAHARLRESYLSSRRLQERCRIPRAWSGSQGYCARLSSMPAMVGWFTIGSEQYAEAER